MRKSTLGRTILQLIEPTQACTCLNGRCLTDLKGAALREARKDFRVSRTPVFLNPRMTVYDTLAEALLSHQSIPKSELSHNGLPSESSRPFPTLHPYPHEFSGDSANVSPLRERWFIEPKLLVADEGFGTRCFHSGANHQSAGPPVRVNLTMIFISHDLSVVEHIADRIALYLGKIVNSERQNTFLTDHATPTHRPGQRCPHPGSFQGAPAPAHAASAGTHPHP